MISLFRSAVAGPRQRPFGALAILTVIVGVVMMHSMSGSPTAHVHAVPHDAAVVEAPQASAEQTTAEAAAEPGTGDCHDGCGGHDLATAMCLMILVALLALVVPVRRLLWRAPLEWSMPLRTSPVAARGAAAPSLHELCISRT